jgi:hypothetical protein
MYTRLAPTRAAAPSGTPTTTAGLGMRGFDSVPV